MRELWIAASKTVRADTTLTVLTAAGGIRWALRSRTTLGCVLSAHGGEDTDTDREGREKGRTVHLVLTLVLVRFVDDGLEDVQLEWEEEVR